MNPSDLPRRNLLDRVVGWVSPTAGLGRWQARTRLAALDGSYKGGRKDRRATRNWRPGGGSPDADVLLDLPDLRNRSRDLARNTPVATGAIATTTNGVIGDGLRLQASIDNAALGITPEQADVYEREQEREWETFMRRCDFTTVQCFDEMQVLAFRAIKESGDVVIVRRYRKDAGDVYGTKLQILEADRLSNPKNAADTDQISGGVETNADGVPIGYHISSAHPGGVRLTALTWERVAARSDDGLRVVLHLFERTRPELSRGVPYLAPVIEHFKQLSDYSDAEVTAAVVSAMFTMVIETPNDGDGFGPPIGEVGDANLAANEVKLGSGAVLSLAPGEVAKDMDPSRPNSNFAPFVSAFMQQIGVALQLPLELLLKHFEASYSASRAALEMAWSYFNQQRSWIAYRFNQEVYGWAMDEAVASGRIARPGWFSNPMIREAYLSAEWIGPRRWSLNPAQEASADQTDIQVGVKTREQVCIERTGGDIEKKLDQLVKENTRMVSAGLVADPAAPPAPAEPDDEKRKEEDDAT
jgi:lambda family phage portal protein